MLKKKKRQGSHFTICDLSVSPSLFRFFLEGQCHRSSSPGKKTLRWRSACILSTGEYSQVNIWKGREGGETGQKKVGCDAITTDTSADPAGSSEAWVALQKGPELRNEE